MSSYQQQYAGAMHAPPPQQQQNAQQAQHIQASPGTVGQQFVTQYYTVLHTTPQTLHRFYTNDSSLTHADSATPGSNAVVKEQKNIHKRIMELDFQEAMTEVWTVDCQHSSQDGILVQVAGSLKTKGSAKRPFLQTFFLAVQEKGYYVLNDIFRYLPEAKLAEVAGAGLGARNLQAYDGSYLAQMQQHYAGGVSGGVLHPGVPPPPPPQHQPAPLAVPAAPQGIPAPAGLHPHGEPQRPSATLTAQVADLRGPYGVPPGPPVHRGVPHAEPPPPPQVHPEVAQHVPQPQPPVPTPAVAPPAAPAPPPSTPAQDPPRASRPQPSSVPTAAAEPKAPHVQAEPEPQKEGAPQGAAPKEEEAAPSAAQPEVEVQEAAESKTEPKDSAPDYDGQPEEVPQEPAAPLTYAQRLKLGAKAAPPAAKPQGGASSANGPTPQSSQGGGGASKAAPSGVENHAPAINGNGNLHAGRRREEEELDPAFGTSVFVRNLPPTMTAEKLYTAFSAVGKIKAGPKGVKLHHKPADPAKSKSDGTSSFAFIEFETAKSMQAAIKGPVHIDSLPLSIVQKRPLVLRDQGGRRGPLPQGGQVRGGPAAFQRQGSYYNEGRGGRGDGREEGRGDRPPPQLQQQQPAAAGQRRHPGSGDGRDGAPKGYQGRGGPQGGPLGGQDGGRGGYQGNRGRRGGRNGGMGDRRNSDRRDERPPAVAANPGEAPSSRPSNPAPGANPAPSTRPQPQSAAANPQQPPAEAA